MSFEMGGRLNLKFSLGEPSYSKSYYYSNLWLCEDNLTSQALPKGARWFKESWKGTILPYAEIAGDAEVGERLYEYARRVYDVAASTLMG